MIGAAMRLTAAEAEALAWLCEMAAIGCLYQNRSAWAAQLHAEARRLRGEAGR